MAQQIEVNGEILEFPDEMTTEQIKFVLSEQYQPQTPNQPQTPANDREIGKTEAAVTGFGQGATLGFGDEIIAALTAPVVYGGSRLAEAAGFDTKGLADKTLVETYRSEQQKGQAEIEQAAEQQPLPFLGGELAGSVAGVGKLAKLAPKGVTQGLRTGGLPSRMAKGAGLGAVSSGVYGAGVADPDQISETAMKSAAAGALVGGAIPVAGQFLKSKPVQKTSEQIRKEAGALYKKAAERGGALKPKVVDDFIDDIKSLAPQTPEGKAFAGDDPFTKLVDSAEILRGKSISLKGAQEIDELLSNRIDKFVDPKTGILTKEGLKAQKMQNAFRSKIEKAGVNDVVGSKRGFEALKQARKLWAKSARVRDVEKIISRAEQTDNPATALRTGFRTLSNNPSRLRGFSKVEREAVKRAAKTGVVTDTLRVMGSRLLPIGAMATGGGIGGATAAQLGSISARGLAGKMQAKRAENVLNTIYGKGAKQLPRYPLSPALAAPIVTQPNTDNGS